jgi:subtilisin family serine protease
VLEPASDGADPDIAILDTGVPSPKELAAWHPDLDDAVRRDTTNPSFPDDRDTLYENGNAPSLRALAGHGTFIAGLVRLVAPDLVISPYAVLDPDGIGNDIDVARALLHVASRPMSVPVVSMSLGAYTYDDAPPPALQHVLDRLPRTTVVVASAGNDGVSRPFYPAALARVVGVAAFDDLGGVVRPAPWSNFGPWVDVCAPGVGLLSSYVAGTYETSPGVVETFDEPTPSARWSGTSFASPLVAAEIARRVREDADTGTWPSGPLTADQAWRDLQAELERVGSDRAVGLEYWPPVDPRTPRLP